MSAVTCPYCQQPAALITGTQLYGSTCCPGYEGRHYWRCDPCRAHVGCHPGTTKPYGTLANASLRRARGFAHNSFDLLWRDGEMTRKDAYAWLREAMGLDRPNGHIGVFDEEQCREVVRLCRERRAA